MSTSSLEQTPFSFSRTKYRPENAYWMATIAKHAYEKCDDGSPNKEEILNKLQSLGDHGTKFKDVIPFDKNSSQAILVIHENYAVAAFRGTDELADWWDNINALPEAGPFGSVHQGFQGAMKDVWPAMRVKLRALRKERGPLPLWLTGHSLGGAMATLAASQLIHADEPFYGVYTFGQPRCGDRDFARTFNNEAKSRFFRFQNNNDIVTRIPARLMGYSHVGTFVYISSEGKLSTDVGWWYQFVDGVKGVIEDIGDKGIDAVEDHDMGEYLSAIKAWGNNLPED